MKPADYDVVTLPELLQEAGYWTVLSGKWHLGLKADCGPQNRGFDKSFAMLPGQTNHWGFEPQLKTEPNMFFKRIPILYTEDGVKRVMWVKRAAGAHQSETNTANDPEKGFYSSTFYTDKLIEYFGARSSEEKEKPFFAMLPFAAPHWPLQCSQADREKYRVSR